MNAVLLVDDERDFADALAERLQARGFRVTTAYDGEEALRLAAGLDFDVAVLDVNLPGMDGLALLRELRALRPQAEALMLTGSNDLATAVAGMKLGASDYLVKPVPIERLAEALSRAQRRREERLEGQRMAETAKMAALGRMAEGVAHEINNPVNTMVNLAGWLDDLVDDLYGLPGCAGAPALAEMRQSVRKMREHGQRCKEITGKLLCLRHEDDAGRAQPLACSVESALDLGALLTGQLAARRDRMEHANVRQRIDIPSSLPKLCLPAAGLPGSDLTTAIGNILDNALDAMPEGGELRLRAETGDHEVRVIIEDTGCGIAPAHMPRIFEPFFSTKAVGQGTGLGLTVSYGTVKALGGDIDITSQPGAGARVLVTLPS